MSTQFILPDLGEGLTEAEIVSWLVAPGDTIAIDQPVVEVESAKSVVELPSPYGGVVGKLHAEVGATVHAGQPLITMAGDNDAAESEPTEGAGAARTDTESADTEGVDVVPGTAVRETPDAPEEGSGAVLIGYGTQERKRGPSKAGSGRFGGGTKAAVTPAAPATVESTVDSTVEEPAASGSPVVSPLVRKLARDHGFNANELVGTGPGSLVLRADVEARIAQGASAASAPAQRSTAARAEDQRIPLTGLRKIVAERMTASRRDIPEATIWLDVDATALLEAKESLQRSTGERYSLNALISRFVVAGLKQFPILNSSIDMAAGEIVQHGAINLGIAAQTARGLMVPVIHGAGEMTTNGLRDSLSTLVETAKTGNFANEMLRGGTFTLNNYGGFGMDGSAPIINQPEVAMLGLGRIIDRPWVVDGQIVVRKIMVLSMVFDHRVCDGDVPSEFMGFITRCIENPISVLSQL